MGSFSFFSVFFSAFPFIYIFIYFVTAFTILAVEPLHDFIHISLLYYLACNTLIVRVY